MRNNVMRKARPCSRKDIRNFAKIIRKLEKSQNSLYFDIVHFLDVTLPKIMPDFSLEIVDPSEMSEEGLTFPNKCLMKLRADVYEGANNGDGRCRLTICHELFHLIYHVEENISFARDARVDVKAYEDPEWQADAFGGELLMPHDLIQGMTLEQVMYNCKVTKSAAVCNLKLA